jgi:hypothetical protein
MKIKYLAAYLTGKYDYNRKQQVHSNDFNYIKAYYESIQKLKLQAIIFIDNASEDFIDKYSNEYVSFYQVNENQLTKNMHPHDARFLYFEEYIKQDTNTDYFVLTDVSDVIILNPIEEILQLNKNLLYVGFEGELISENVWFRKTYGFRSIRNNYHFFDSDNLLCNRILLNCGTLLGSRETILIFLFLMKKTFNSIYSFGDQCAQENDSFFDKIPAPLDMFVTNYIIHKFFYDDNLFKGHGFTSLFSGEYFDMTTCVKHK